SLAKRALDNYAAPIFCMMVAALQRYVGHKLNIQCPDVYTGQKRGHCLCEYPSVVSAVHVSAPIRIVIGTVCRKVNVFTAMVETLAIVPRIVVAIAVIALLDVLTVFPIALLVVFTVLTVSLFRMFPICFI